MSRPRRASPREIVPTFLVGVPRSGTTLLRMLLGQHPRILAGEEAPWLGGNYGQLQASLRGLHDRLRVDRRSPLAAMPGVTADHLGRALRSLVSELVGPALAASGKHRWLEKTPDNVAQVPFLHALYPTAKFIHVVRDGRDVALSTLRTSWGELNYFVERTSSADLPPAQEFRPLPKSYETALERWCAWVGKFEADAARLGVDHVTVRFEDFLGAPRTELAKILRFLGEEWSDQVLEYTQTDAVGADEGKASLARRDRIETDDVEGWRRELTEAQRALTRERFDRCLSAHGYPPTEAASAALDRAQDSKKPS